MSTRKIIVEGLVYDDIREVIEKKTLTVLITNNEHGKTLSINDDRVQFTVPAEKIAEYLK